MKSDGSPTYVRLAVPMSVGWLWKKTPPTDQTSEMQHIIYYMMISYFLGNIYAGADGSDHNMYNLFHHFHHLYDNCVSFELVSSVFISFNFNPITLHTTLIQLNWFFILILIEYYFCFLLIKSVHDLFNYVHFNLSI